MAAQTANLRESFDAAVAPHVADLRGLAFRMVGHAQDAEDVVQDALVRAFDAFARFEGRSQVKTWLWTIVTRASLDHLRRKKRFRVDVLGEGQARCTAAGLHPGLLAIYAQPDLRFDVHQHIAFCFTCVGRTLAPEVQAAIILREVLGLDAREAAEILDVTESVLRHRVAEGRARMTEAFEGLCALVNKAGSCHQCKTLRELAPAERRGAAPPSLEYELATRLAIVRDHGGRASTLHDYLLRAFGSFHET